MHLNNIDILMVGHFAKDKLIVDGVEEFSSGGGIYYGSVVLKRLGVKVAVATRLHPDDFPLLEELREQGVEVFAAPAPQTTGIANYYNSADMERRICKPIGFAGKMLPQEIPTGPVKLIIIASIIAGEVDLVMLKELAKRAPVGLDVQGFVRIPEGNDLIYRPWIDMAEGLKHVHYLKVDRAEAEYLTGNTDLKAAAIQLSSFGPREILITQSSGVTVYADGKFFDAPFTPRTLAGRTGRGDTCFSTYLGKRLTETPDIACQWAGAVTTLKQEKPGPWRGSIDDVAQLIKERSIHL